MPTLFDLMPKETASGKPLFYTFWAEFEFGKSVKDRPWAQVLVDPTTRHCYPISHTRPAKNADKYFHIRPDDPDFVPLNIETESWVCPKLKRLPKGIRRRREGIMAGEMAVRFSGWLAKVSSNPAHADEFDEAPALITPWIYADDMLIPVLPSELLACEFMAASKASRNLPPGAMVYDDASGRLLTNKDGIPSIGNWLAAYTEHLWRAAMTDGARREWVRMCGLPHMERYVRSLIAGYVDNVVGLGVKRDATSEVVSRGSLAQCVMEHLSIPPMENEAVRGFVSEQVAPFILA